jgi:hypothetical protein
MKANRMLQWESIAERNAFCILEIDPDVDTYNEQPCEIEFEIDGTVHTHFPDILVEGWGGKHLIEIKYLRDAMDPSTVRRTEFMCRELPNHGFTYQVYIAEDLARRPRIENIAFVLRWGRTQITPIVREQVRQWLKCTGTLTWEMVAQGLLPNITRREICSLIVEGHLSIDFDTPIHRSTAIFSGPKSR